MTPLVYSRRVLFLAMSVAALAVLATALIRPSDPPAVLRVLLVGYVATLGWLVAAYAATNLRGQAGTLRFAVLLVTTVAGLLLMVSVPELAVAALGWTISGAATAALVAHRGDGPARRASLVVARRLVVGDAALWTAVALTYAADGSRTGDTVAALLLAVAVLVRSALVPAQRWLPETAEAPSPVSALLHAGVVNGGAVFALLFWPVLSASRTALGLLVVAGIASVGVGLAAMRLRPDVKGRLAASTTAQMGLVAIQLGLALPAAALLHVLGHGCWKAWLFLRAGGSAGRVRSSSSGPSGRLGRRAAAAVGVVAVSAAVLASTVSAGLVLPAALGTAVAAVGVAESSQLRRTGRCTRVGLALVAAVVPAAYLGWVAVVEHATEDWFGAGASPAPLGVVLAAAGLVVAVGLAVTRLRPDSSGPFATAVAVSLLPPRTLVAGRVRNEALAPDPSPGGLPVNQVGMVVELAATAVGPGWPLRSLVAANPLAPLEKLAVEDAASAVRILHGQDPRPSLATFLDLHARGVISDSAVRRALAEHDPSSAEPGRQPHLGRTGPSPLSGISPGDLAEFTRAITTHDADDGEGRPGQALPKRVRACDQIATATGRSPEVALDLQVAAWTARAWATATVADGSTTDPWSLWLRSARTWSFEWAWRVRGARELARSLPAEPELAIAALWPRMRGLVGDQDLYTYLASAFAAGRGWAAHARWRARMSGDPRPLVQLAALQMALDLLIAESALGAGGTRTSPADRSAAARAGEQGPRPDTDAATRSHLVSVWQRSLDLSARDGLLRSLAPAAGTVDPPAGAGPNYEGESEVRVHSVWCIDARSERMRRHLERLDPHLGHQHETYGYAGFFGAAIERLDADGHRTELCPGILRPVVTVSEQPREIGAAAAARRLAARVGSSPVAAFGWAEMSGAPALAGTLAASLLPRRWRTWSALEASDAPHPGRLPHDVAVDVVEGLLVGTGLASRLLACEAGESPATQVVLLVGHRSSTENNAYASAYDCGACGGNSGEVNASLVATALNDDAVRATLAARGTVVPPSVLAAAAVHDTTTDQVTLLRRRSEESPAVTGVLDGVARDLMRAGGEVRVERDVALPASGRPGRLASVAERAADWAEPMPEWGLAGAMALVVGPRRMTAGLDLGGTTFLHSYDPGIDPEGLVLEQIMTGPVVVTHWINSQYYFSVASPELLGAGDKTTHNVVGDVGVMTGAHGDIRVGLPWQAIASRDPGGRERDTSALRHLPARHLILVAGDPDRLLEIVRRHATLYQMFGNGWTQLVVLAPDGRTLELDRHLCWQPCEVPSAGRADPRHAGHDAGHDAGTYRGHSSFG